MTWLDLGIVILSDVSQTEKKYPVTSLICGISKEMIQMNLKKRNRLTDLEKELMVVGKRGKVERR